MEKKDTAFTGIKDVDQYMLQNLSDEDLAKVCVANKYLVKICSDDTFWMNRVLNKYGNELGSSEFIRKKYLGNSTWQQYYFWLTDAKGGDIDRTFFSAIDNGRTDVVKIIIEGVDFLKINDGLRRAVDKGDTEMVETILKEAGALVYLTGEFIHNASQKGYTDIVRLLINYGSDPSFANNVSIISAYQNKHFDTVKLLLKDPRVNTTLTPDQKTKLIA